VNEEVKPDEIKRENKDERAVGGSEDKVRGTQTYLGVLGELDVNADQWNRRKRLLADLESALSERYGAVNRVFAYIFRSGHPRALITSADIPSFESTVASLSDAEQINLILHSPGGDGTIIEKMVEMSRSHCRGVKAQFRVIVPNIAKSAATLLALGADKLIMGYCSELGPIDPQLLINVSGAFQQVSAQSFLDARDSLMKQIQEAQKEKKDALGYLQQLAGLNIPFTKECENHIEFSRKTAAQLLSRYMLRARIKNETERDKKAIEIAGKLLSKQLFPAHGQFIDGKTARDQLELDVELLDKDDSLWKLIWEYYTRSEIQMNIPLPQLGVGYVKVKLFESREVSLVTPDVQA
jgi:ATP-dependent protease ClpP protease subunit